MRSRTWDMYNGDGPEKRLDVLLGALGAARKPVTEQQQALRDWLGSAPAHAAPPELLLAVRKFLEVPAE
jgi:hypothetical protein